MKLALSFSVSVALATAAIAMPHEALACGGCMTTPGQVTQVTGHRMILSVSPQQTTLWDQIKYTGNPTDFAWILPVHGTVTIGLSSDALFGLLDQITDETVIPPPYPNCPGYYCDATGTTGAFMSGAAGSSTAGGGVNVVSEQVVGPYETVQLQATDPSALYNWLSSHGYELPPSIKPVTDAYIAEGFDFLAMKLVPGQNVAAMRPVRITTSGAGLSLPLRMVAAGTGAITPIKLWVIGQGRYEPSNMPTFTITDSQVVWDFATYSSNLSVLREQGFVSTNNTGWLVESSIPISQFTFDPVLSAAQYQPSSSGYGDDAQGTNALMNANTDVAALVGSISGQLTMTRLDAELSRVALANDLELGASANQGMISPTINPGSVKNEPTCPPTPQCNGSNGSSGSVWPWNIPGAGGTGGSGGAGATPSGSAGCSIAGGTGIPAIVLAGIALAAGTRRRRSRPQVTTMRNNDRHA